MPSLVLGDAQKLFGIIASILAFAAWVGSMKSDVTHLKDDSAAMRAQLDKLYDHVAWGNKGEVGPRPPVSPESGQAVK